MMVLMLGVQVTAVAQTQVNSAANGKVVAAKNITALDGRQVQLSVSGQMPSKAKVQATPVQRTSPNGKQVFGAYDITIQNGNAEWQPQAGQPVMVSISDPNFTDGQMMDVYHEGANGNEFVATVAAQNGKITFPARSFSVYIVTETGDDARLKVNFYQNSQQVADDTPVVIYVKKADDASGHLNTVVYDPGVGALDAGVSFRGWIKDNPNYTYADVENALTIAKIRTQVKNILLDETDPVQEGDEVNYYAMLFKSYIVSYYDGSPATLGSDNVTFRADATQTQYPYTISRTYVPTSSEYNFMGWVVSESTASNIVSTAPADGLYQFADQIVIKGNVNFTVDEEEGHWLVFDENGRGATYNAPQFVKNGEVTSPYDLLIMERPGYTFGGWYTDAECTDGNEFEFGHPLTERTIIYAKWTAHEQAGYSVIVWEQKLTDQSDPNNPNADYNFGQTIRIEDGAVGTHPNVVVGTIGNASVSINGTTVSKEGFHYAGTDQAEVTITPEGTSVVNVYMDRNEITLNFNIYNYTYTATTSNNGTQYGLVDGEYVQLTRQGLFNYTWTYGNGITYTGTRYTRSGGSWGNYKTFTGRYSSKLTENGYTWPVEYDWYETGGNNGNTSGTRTTFLDAFLPSSNSTTVNFYGRDPEGSNHVYFYKQNSDLSGYTLANTVNTDASGFNLTDKYDGYTCTAWNTSNNTNNWNVVGELMSQGTNNYYDANPNQSGYQTASIGNNGLHVYFNVKTFDIAYASGSTFTGNNGVNEETGAPTYGMYEETLTPDILNTKSSVAYGLNINGDEYKNAPAEDTWPEGYVFDGWYADDQCTTPYVFSTMPANNIMLYAKWRQIRFRVFLHPNAYIEDEEEGTLVKDETLDWGIETQQMNFGVAWGGKISAPTGRRSGYEFIGWFTDSEFQHPFDKDALIMNNTNVPAVPEYDKTVDMTDVMDKWGEIVDPATAFNSDDDRPWVQRKYDLYAQWRATVEGAIGIDVVYDAGDYGTNAPVDQNHYLDMTKAVAGAAATSTDPTSKVFSHWVVQKYNCTTQQFEDTQVSVFPGENFTVRRSQSRIKVTQWCDPECESPQNNEEECVYTVPEDQQTYCNQTNVPETFTKIYNAEYTIRVRAEYLDVEQPVPTFIIWYNNYEGADPAVLRQDGNTGQEGDTHEELIVNFAVSIPTPAARPGYTFKGWSKYNVQSTSNVPTTHETDENDPNFLIYVPGVDGEAGTYTSVAGDPATEVAADEANPYDYLYAVWEANGYTVRFNKNAEDATGTMEDQLFEFDQEQALTPNAFTYTDHCFQGWATSATSTTVAYTDGQSVSNLTDVPGDVVNLYAVWQEKVTPTFELENSYCVGAEVELPETSANGIAGTWSPATVSTTAATTAPVTYTFTPTDATCNNIYTIDITINPLPTVTLTVPTDAQDLCPNKGTYEVSATAANGAEPYSYSWTDATPTTENGPVANVTQEDGNDNCTPNGTNYTVSVVATDANGCASAAAQGSFTVQMAEGEFEYTMTGVEVSGTVDCASELPETVAVLPTVTDACDNVLEPTMDSPVISAIPDCGGEVTYTYTYTDCAGNTADWVFTYTINEPANPTLELAEAEAIPAGDCQYEIPTVEYEAAAACDGELTVTQLPEAGYTIDQTDEDQEVEIAVTAVDGCNKSTTKTTTVIIPAKPTVSITTDNPTTCYGSSVTLNATEGFESYEWSHDEEATTAEITVTDLTETTTFTVTVFDANGCTATASQEVTVDEIGTANITGANEVCMNGDVTLTAPEGVSYMWSTQATDQSITISKMTQTTTFYVTVTDANGCVSEGEIEVTVNPLPVVELTVPTTEQDLCPNQEIYEVSATVTSGVEPYTFTWSGDATAQEDNLSHADVFPPADGDCTPNGHTYTVSVVVTDDNGCASATAEESFTVLMATGGITMTEVPTQSIVTCAQEIVEPTLPTVTDACGNTLEPIDLDISPEIPSVCDGEQTYTYTYEDCVGNSVEWVYTFIFQAPVLTFDGEIIDEEGIDACYSAALADEYLLDDAAVKAMFSSDCELDEITVSHVDATKEDNNDCDWEIQRIFTIRNACTTVYKTQVLTGGDQTAPTFTAPAAYTTTFNPDGTYNIDPEDAGEVEDATDNCTTITESNIDYVDETEENEDGSLTITRTWTVTDNCELSTSDDQIITVNPISDPVVVYITGDQVTETYNGTWFVASGYTVDNVTINGETTTAYTENDFEFNSNAHAERKDAGKTDMGISSDDFVNTNPIFSNVTFVVEDGFVQVNKKPITIFANVSKQYDGTPLQITYEDVTVTPDLADGDELTDGILYTDGYDAGEYRCTANQFEYMMALNAIQEDFTIENSEHQKVNANYSPTFDVTLTITSPDCQGVTYQDYYYPAVQIGTQCWLAENLRNTVYGPEETTDIANYAAFNNDPANMEKFGYLYTWYSTVGVEENNDAELPETLEGTSLVQGICPEGWVVPSQTDFDILYQFTANEERRLRDMNTMYWIPGEQGVEPNYHFNSRAGGFYNSVSGHFERLLLEDYYWTSTSDPNSTEVTSPTNAYYCNSIDFKTSKKADMRSVRCISQQTAYGAPTETEEGEGDEGDGE